MVSFFFSERSDIFFIWLFYLFHVLRSSAFQGTFFSVKFHLTIFSVYPYSLYYGFELFFIFDKEFKVIVIIIIIIIIRSRVCWWSSIWVSKSSQVSWPLLSILADLSNVLFSRASSHASIFSSLSKPLRTAPNSTNTTAITITYMFYNFFDFLNVYCF